MFTVSSNAKAIKIQYIVALEIAALANITLAMCEKKKAGIGPALRYF